MIVAHDWVGVGIDRHKREGMHAASCRRMPGGLIGQFDEVITRIGEPDQRSSIGLTASSPELDIAVRPLNSGKRPTRVSQRPRFGGINRTLEMAGSACRSLAR
jgi:hypothetical protein